MAAKKISTTRQVVLTTSEFDHVTLRLAYIDGLLELMHGEVDAANNAMLSAVASIEGHLESARAVLSKAETREAVTHK